MRPEYELSQRELFERINEAGFSDIADAILYGAGVTRKGRINKSGIARILGVSAKEANERLEQFGKLLIELGEHPYILPAKAPRVPPNSDWGKIGVSTPSAATTQQKRHTGR